MKIPGLFFSFFLFFFCDFGLFAEVLLYSSHSFLEIESANSKNAIFRQVQQDIESNEILSRRGEKIDLIFFRYKFGSDKELNDFLAICGRFCLHYGALAVLNEISFVNEDLTKKNLIIPNANGIFLSENQKFPYETLIAKRLKDEGAKSVKIQIDGENFDFFIGKKFSSVECAYFLDFELHLPLEKSVITSEFGSRISPISGEKKFHAGIDLASPFGAKVFACKTGIVSEAAFNDVYGNYIKIAHEGGKSSLYAHLSKILVKKAQKVFGGQKIGEVGSSGMSTGPHLHFEYGENGKKIDPKNVLKF